MPEDVKQAVAPAAEPEAPAAVETAPKQEQPQKDPRIADLERRERAFWKQVKQFKAQRAAFEKEKAPAPQPEAPSKPDWGRLKTDFMGVLADAGMTPDEAANFILQGNPQDAHIKRLEAKIAELEGKTEATSKKFDETQQKAYSNAIKQLNSQVKLLVDGSEDFETIRATKSEEAVVALIEDTFNKEGTMLSVEQAAKMVEDYLTDETLNLTKLKKIQAKLQPPVEPAVKEEKKIEVKQKNQGAAISPAPTLSRDTVSPMAGQSSSSKARRDRAIAILEGRIKS